MLGILVPLVRSVPGGTIEGILGASVGSLPIVRPSMVAIRVPGDPDVSVTWRFGEIACGYHGGGIKGGI